MKSKVAISVVVLSMFVVALGTAAAQNATTQGSTASQNKQDNVRTITGCLQKGEGDNQYNLIAQDGSTWEIRSDSVDLASHLGHTVAVTGAVKPAGTPGMKEGAKTEAQEHGMDKSATEHGQITVTELSMVSEGCQK